MTPQQRIKELQTRQRWDGPDMTVSLFSVNGYFDYEVTLDIITDEKKMLPWVDIWKMNLKRNNVGGQKLPVSEKDFDGRMVKARIVRRCVIMTGKYKGEDPQDLIANAEKIVGKWRCGEQIQKPMGVAS